MFKLSAFRLPINEKLGRFMALFKDILQGLGGLDTVQYQNVVSI